MQFGRKQIFTDVTQITKDNVIKVLQDALIVHEQNRTAIKFLLVMSVVFNRLMIESKRFVRKSILR